MQVNTLFSSFDWRYQFNKFASVINRCRDYRDCNNQETQDRGWATVMCYK